jgi:phage-related minor tail protein
MLEFFVRPLRSVLGVAEHEVVTPLRAEHEIANTVQAVHRVADSIEHHIEVVEGLATSVGPLTESVNKLTKTMDDLVKLLAPMAIAERDVQSVEHEAAKVERLFTFRRRKA